MLCALRKMRYLICNTPLRLAYSDVGQMNKCVELTGHWCLCQVMSKILSGRCTTKLDVTGFLFLSDGMIEDVFLLCKALISIINLRCNRALTFNINTDWFIKADYSFFQVRILSIRLLRYKFIQPYTALLLTYG